MDDREFIGQSDYIKLILWIVVMAVPVALLTLIYLALYHKGSQLVSGDTPRSFEHLPPGLYHPGCHTRRSAGWVGPALPGGAARRIAPKRDGSRARPYRGVPGLVVTALVGLASGASLGPEGPLGHMGAAVASWVAERLKLPKERSRIMTLSGVSAAFGGFLASPFGGAFMSMEFTGSLAYPIYANLIAATTSALFGTLVVFSFTGLLPRGLLNFPEYSGFQWMHILYAVIFGLVGMVWAFLFKIIFGFVTRLATPLNRFPVLKPVVGGLVFGLVGAWLPLTLYSGEEELNMVLG